MVTIDTELEFPWSKDEDAVHVLDVDTAGTYFDLTVEGMRVKKEFPELYNKYVNIIQDGREPGDIDFVLCRNVQFCFMFVANRLYGSRKDTKEDVMLYGQVCIDDLVENLASEFYIPIVSGIFFRKHSLFNQMKKYIETKHPLLNWTVLKD